MEQALNVKIKVRNDEFATRFLVAVFPVNPANNSIKCVRMNMLVAIKILSTKKISLPEAIPKSWKTAVLTAYGNIFWEES